MRASLIAAFYQSCAYHSLIIIYTYNIMTEKLMKLHCYLKSIFKVKFLFVKSERLQFKRDKEC